MMRPFNPLTITLAGRQLIEASAGTGKTFSLALLFLRLILEQGLEVEQILVVTFTNAATEELRGRIRARLREALDILEGTVVAKGGDVLAGLLAALPDRDGARGRLADTLTRMDEAAIYTIHGFCQRMLQDQAFEAGTAFTARFIESEQLLRREVIEDFWRQRFYRASAEEAEWATANWQDPAGVYRKLQGFLARPEVAYVPAVSARELQDLRQFAASRWQEVRTAWLQGREEVTAILQADPCLSRNKSCGYGGESLLRVIAGMEQLAARESMAWLLPKGVELLASSVMACNLIGKKTQPAHSFFTLFDDWHRLHGEFSRAARAWTLAEAHRFLRAELRRRKQEQNVLSFDDLLSRLAEALAGKEGPLLARRIRARFRVALVDEFQDTDPLQYRIFQTLFGREPDPGLFMIGDPKQSIYFFRGADIFAYIRARRETPAGAVHTMDSNYRSTPAMVQAVNRLFSRRPHFVFAELAFSPVRAGLGPEGGELQVAGAVPAPLQVQMLPLSLAAGKAAIAKDRAAEAAAAWTAGEIARLLQLGRSGEARIGEKALVGKDLAVLVRTHREAALVRRALAGLNIASVYYSQDSVFATDEARQLHQLLAALLDLSDGAGIANALVTDLFGLDAFALHSLRGDQLRWGEVTAELAAYHQRWSRAGVMAMLHLLLHRRQVVSRLLTQSGGERKLTNFLHLGELLEAAAGRYRMDELVRWFSQQMLAPEPEAASQQLRLESDGDLVKIVTIHQAKGLEYPLVFLPFLWSARPVQRDEIFAYHGPGAEGQDAGLYVDLGSGREENYRRAEQERLAEDLRLLYVAVTRARCCCYCCWGPVNSLEQSALTWLLHADDRGGNGVAPDLREERIRADLADLDGGQGLLHFVPWPVAEGEKSAGNGTGQGHLPGPPVFTGRIDTSWAVTSYSRLLAGSGDAVSPAVGGDDGETPGRKDDLSVFTFPRGAAAGTFLHAVLEQLDFQDPPGPGAAESIADLLRRGGLAPYWAKLVLQWLTRVADTPLLPQRDLRLRHLPREDRLPELGFHFALADFAPATLNALLREYAVPPVAMPPARLQGLMKGFIDLVFRYEGRYYLADYKSNYLGPALADYRPENLARAMAAHRYDLQYLIYSVALHRYLRCRLPGYDYDRDFGGVFYLFLRGMHPDLGPGNGVWHVLPNRALIEGLDRCCGLPEGQ